MVIVLIVQWAQNWVLITAVMNHLSLLLLLSRFSRVQLCLCDPIDGSPPGSPVSGILQARILTGVGCHFLLQCMKVKSESEVTQSCPTLSDPMDCSLPGSSIHGSFQARVLEWVTSAFSKNLLTFVHFQSLKNFHVCYHQLFEED